MRFLLFLVLLSVTVAEQGQQQCTAPEWWDEKGVEAGPEWSDDPRCKDDFPDCSLWASHGECDLNPQFMVPKCPVSCKTCFLLNPAASCKRLKGAPAALRKGAVLGHFQKIVDDFPDLKPEIKHSGDPVLLYFDNFLDDDTISDLLQAYTDAGLDFAQSIELDSRPGEEARRTSQSIQCNVGSCWRDPRVVKVHEHVRNVTGHPLVNQEFIQIVKYEIGQKYVNHHDTSPTYRQFPQGHRVYTLFLYLSDVDDGGETNFPRLGISVKPKKGAAVLWSNVLQDNPDILAEDSMHAALPVKAGTKVAANLWMYQHNYRDPWMCEYWKSVMQHAQN